MLQLLIRFWNSPTFMTWGNYGIQSLRLFLVTPLILTRFDQTEIAAWYLFASLNFFGNIVGQRFGITYARMFSFAMGGASCLAPKQHMKRASVTADALSPNWEAFARAYGTLGVLLCVAAVLNLIVGLGMGWFGLSNLLDGYETPHFIWLAFIIVQVTQVFLFIYRRYTCALMGMNYVALNARWAMMFGLLSVVAGALTLCFGGGVLVLALVMQLTALAGPLRQRFLLSRVEDGQVCRMSAWRFDREAFSWGWTPTWKGFMAEMGITGGAQIVAVLYTGYAGTAEVAAYLFAIRMRDTIVELGQVPYASVQPKMSRLFSQGNADSLSVLIKERYRVVYWLSAAGLVSAGLLLPWLIGMIGSNVEFIAITPWLVLSGMTLLMRFVVLNSAICAMGNDPYYYREMFTGFIISMVIMLIIRGSYGIYGPILATTLPPLVLINIRSMIRSARILNQKPFRYLLPDFMAAFSSFLLASIVVWWFLQ